MKVFDINKAFKIMSGEFIRNDTSVFSIIRNEMYFVPAFLDHYRNLGYKQFVFLDDRSDDGTFEFLSNQKDCVLLRSEYRFGEPVIYNKTKKGISNRAGTLLKDIIPFKIFSGNFVTYVDADEFILLPSEFKNISNFISFLKEKGVKAVHASSIEFYPENLDGIHSKSNPISFAEIIDGSPFFDNVQLIKFAESENRRNVGKIIGNSASDRLFAREAIKDIRLPWAHLPQFLLKMLPVRNATTHVIKTPILFRDETTRMQGSHYANIPATHKVSVALAHFVFTSNLPKKINNSIKWKSHARGATKYVSYSKLLESMKNDNSSFLGPHSERFTDVKQLERAKLIVGPG